MILIFIYRSRYVQALMTECKRRYPILSGVQRRKLGALARHARTKYVWGYQSCMV